MNLQMLPLLCCLLMSSPSEGRVYLKETFATGADVCEFKRTILLELRCEGKVHKWKKNGTFPGDAMRHLLTLLLFPNDTYAVKLDMQTIAGGRLVEDFTEFPPEYIYNASAARPDDWDEQELYEDPSDGKPVYWDDEFIPDPEFDPQMTHGLDSEVWGIPTVPNPHRFIEWQPRLLRNPHYNGPWRGQRMKNTAFPTSLHDLGVIGGVAIDIWQPYAGVLFDNILLTDDSAYAEKFAAFSWGDYQRFAKSRKYKQDLFDYTQRVRSSVLAKTKLDPRDALTDEEMADLQAWHHRPHLEINERTRKILRERRHARGRKPFPGIMTKRDALEAFLDVDVCACG